MTPLLEGSKALSRTARWQGAAWYGWALALASTLASSIVTPLSRGIIVAGVDPITLLLLRLSIAITLMGVTLALTQPQHFRISAQGFWRIVGVGLIAGIEICCFFSALAYVDASMSAMIETSAFAFTLPKATSASLNTRHISFSRAVPNEIITQWTPHSRGQIATPRDHCENHALAPKPAPQNVPE